jgi:hypothetical protein
MIPLDSRRSAKPYPLKAFRSRLTPTASTLARPPINPFPCYIFPATGGRVPLVQPRLLTVHCRLLTCRESRTDFSISFISPPYEHQPRMSLVSPTYAKTGGCTSSQKCRRADIFDFPPYFTHFSCPERSVSFASRVLHRDRRACPESHRRVTARHMPASEGGRYTSTESANTHQSPITFLPPVGYITAVLGSYCAGRCQNGT